MGWIHTLRDFRRVQRGPDPHGVAIASSGGAVLAGAGFLALTAPAAGDPLAAKAHSRTVAAPPAFPGFRDRKPPRSPRDSGLASPAYAGLLPGGVTVGA